VVLIPLHNAEPAGTTPSAPAHSLEAIVRGQVERAAQGDAWARETLFDRLFGKVAR
jgi:hypothetical protein